MLVQQLIKRIFEVSNNNDFESLALDVFNHQALQNKVYSQYLNSLRVNFSNIKSIHQIPFLPIQFFKSHTIITGEASAPIIFKSSGTTGTEVSKHLVTDVSIYESSFRKGFDFCFGNVQEYCILALLPSYLEQGNSSLVYMVNDLIKQSNNPNSAFYLHNQDELEKKIIELENTGQKTLLIGVTYALLDFAEKFPMQLKNTIIMETGGMKGKRKELIRDEVHELLTNAFGVENICSEYGMTELLSQGYSKGKGIFFTPPWMKILIRDTEDPFTYVAEGKTGGINVIDLANINSCSFIATQDLGKTHTDQSFQVIGRFDNSDLRGCNLMVE